MIVTTSRFHCLGAMLAPAAAGVVWLFLAGTGLAQSVPQQLGVAPAAEQPQPTTPQAEPERRSAPGLFAAIGRFVDESISTVSSGIGSIGAPAGDAVRGAAVAAKDAATLMIPPTAIVSGRIHCLRTQNGGPDCQAAANLMCQRKGYATGSSLRVQAEQKCPVWGWIAGEKPMGKCSTETYLTSATCR
jgi:hypothetical protein